MRKIELPWDRIAAYEIPSEPRDKTVAASAVREYYEGGCAAAQSVDQAATPCLVGNAPYYKLWDFGENTLLRTTTNAIYTFDWLQRARHPDAFVFGNGGDGGALGAAYPAIPSYGDGASYPCETLYDGWEKQVCPSWNVSRASAGALRSRVARAQPAHVCAAAARHPHGTCRSS